MNYLNASFEAVGALLAWYNVWLVAHTPPAGVSWMAVAFSAVWGLTAVQYYRSHGDKLSAWGAIVRAAGNLVWTVIAL